MERQSAGRPRNPGPPDLDDLHVRRQWARAEAVWTKFTHISAVLAALYLVFAAAHYLLMKPPFRAPMLGCALASSVALFALFLYFRRQPPSIRMAHPLATAVLGFTLLNSGLHFYLTGDLLQTTNFVLITIGAGIFLYSAAWLAGFLTFATLVWAGIAVAVGAAEYRVHFAFFGMQALLIAIIAYGLRMRALDRLLNSQIENETRRLELARSVKELEMAWERMRLLTEASFEAVFLHRLGEIVDVNEQAVRIFGYTRDELKAMELSDLLAPESQGTLPSRRKSLHSFTGARRDGDVHESIALHKDGHRFPIEFGATPRRPASDQIDAVVIRDISDRRKLEHRLHDFVDSAADYIYETDRGGRFTYVNGAIQRISFWNGPLLGGDCYRFVHPSVRDRIREEVEQHDFEAEPTLYQEFRVHTGKEDWERWLGQNVQPIYNRGALTGYRVVARDITDRVMAIRDVVLARQEADEANRGKSRFLSSMSHELRTPLNGILGFAQLLQEEIYGALNERQRKYVASLTECSAHLLTLIDDLLDLSKAEVGAIAIQPAPVSVDVLVQSAWAMIRREASEKMIAIALDIPDGHRVRADSRRARQILINLFSNAVKYAPGASEVRVASRAAGGDQIEIVVEDKGPGVRPEDQEKIFHEFFQADHARDAGLGGSGIGLALVKKLAHLHGGSVGYRDRPGGGSVFWVRLPATREEAVPLESNLLPGQVRPGAGSARILVADDIEANLYLLTEALAGRGHAVETARDGSEAIARARAFKPELILMDMRMPVMDGFEATRELKKLPVIRDIPVVALTASVTPDSVAECIAAGCAEHLAKPIQLNALFDCIDRNLDRSGPSRAPASPANGRGKGPGDRPLRILVAEDNPTSRDFLGEFFSRQPDDAVFATNGREAVELALEQKFDVILMDVSMPEMNGLEATRKIREHKSAGQLPIVGLSGAESGEEVEACMAAGMNDFIAKPVRFARILSMLETYRPAGGRDSEAPAEEG